MLKFGMRDWRIVAEVAVSFNFLDVMEEFFPI